MGCTRGSSRCKRTAGRRRRAAASRPPRSTCFSFGRWTRAPMHFYKLHAIRTSFSWGSGLGFGGRAVRRTAQRHGKFGRRDRRIRQQLTCAPWRGGLISFYREQVSGAFLLVSVDLSVDDMPSRTRHQTRNCLIRKTKLEKNLRAT